MKYIIKILVVYVLFRIGLEVVKRYTSFEDAVLYGLAMIVAYIVIDSDNLKKKDNV